MNDELRGIEELMEEDGFVNFYTILEITPETSPEDALESINALYQEAQTNRDHRVPARRREYQILLEILPQARTILTDKVRRRRYDAYCNAVAMQLPRMPYVDFFNDLMREKEVADTRSDILTVRDLSRLRLSEPSLNGNSAPETPEMTEELLDEEMPEAEAVATPVTESAPATSTASAKPTKASSSVHFFPPQSLVGGALVLLGMLGSLPTLAGVPMVLAAPLAVICAGVTAFVFSMTAESAIA